MAQQPHLHCCLLLSGAGHNFFFSCLVGIVTQFGVTTPAPFVEMCHLLCNHPLFDVTLALELELTVLLLVLVGVGVLKFHCLQLCSHSESEPHLAQTFIIWNWACNLPMMKRIEFTRPVSQHHGLVSSTLEKLKLQAWTKICSVWPSCQGSKKRKKSLTGGDLPTMNHHVRDGTPPH